MLACLLISIQPGLLSDHTAPPGGYLSFDVPQMFCSPCLSGLAAAGVNLRCALRLLTRFLFPAFVVAFRGAQESVSPGISGN